MGKICCQVFESPDVNHIFLENPVLVDVSFHFFNVEKVALLSFPSI